MLFLARDDEVDEEDDDEEGLEPHDDLEDETEYEDLLDDDDEEGLEPHDDLLDDDDEDGLDTVGIAEILIQDIIFVTRRILSCREAKRDMEIEDVTFNNVA